MFAYLYYLSHKVEKEVDTEVRDGFQSKVILEEIISGIYDNRYNKLLLITTPLTKSEFFDTYDGRIIDRLGERAEIIELTGKSYRLNKDE